MKNIADEAVKLMKDYPELTIMEAIEKAKEVMSYERYETSYNRVKNS